MKKLHFGFSVILPSHKEKASWTVHCLLDLLMGSMYRRWQKVKDVTTVFFNDVNKTSDE